MLDLVQCTCSLYTLRSYVHNVRNPSLPMSVQIKLAHADLVVLIKSLVVPCRLENNDLLSLLIRQKLPPTVTLHVDIPLLQVQSYTSKFGEVVK